MAERDQLLAVGAGLKAGPIVIARVSSRPFFFSAVYTSRSLATTDSITEAKYTPASCIPTLLTR